VASGTRSQLCEAFTSQRALPNPIRPAPGVCKLPVREGHNECGISHSWPTPAGFGGTSGKLVTGSYGLARGLVGTFRHGAGRACEKVQSGIDNGDFELARRAAHTLAGASANMGASRLEALAAAMEQAAIQRDGAALRPLAEAARTRLNAALTELNSLTQSPSRTPEPPSSAGTSFCLGLPSGMRSTVSS
jgi:HPt (histidine-containing phosphotransfer) domain-containing protein